MKEKVFEKRNRRVLSGILALSMVPTLIPINNMTVQAADTSQPVCNCTNSNHSYHYYVYELTTIGDSVYMHYYQYNPNGEVNEYSNPKSGPSWSKDRTVEEGHWYYYLNKTTHGECDEAAVAPAHTHGSWDYSADDATLIAECKADGDCDLTEGKVILTLKANDTRASESGYTGASLENGDAFKTATGLDALPDINYVGRGETTYEKSTTAPTAAGTYTASITVGGATATADFEIKPKATNKYTLTIPTETTIENCGYTKLDGSLNIKGDLDSDKSVVVTAEKNNFTLKADEAEGNAAQIGYTIKYGEDKKTLDTNDTIKWTAEDAADNGKSVTVGIDIDEDEYFAAPDGNYEGSIKWTAKLTKTLTKEKVMSIVDDSITNLIDESGQDFDIALSYGLNFTETMTECDCTYSVASNGNHVFSDNKFGLYTWAVVVSEGKVTTVYWSCTSDNYSESRTFEYKSN